MRFRGSVDFGKLAAPLVAAPITGRSNATARYESGGVALEWRPGSADVAARDGIVAVSTGRPDGAGDASAAAWWIDRYFTAGLDVARDVGGDFAVALIDANRKRALLFVDRFAVRTLCYRADGGTVGFSDAADRVPGVGELDAQAIYDYLYMHVIPAPQTVFEGVRRVVAGQRAVVSAAGATAEPYWTPAFVEDDDRDLAGRMKQFVELVRQSVARGATDTKCACFLSGGTDSSTIAGMLSRLRDSPVHAYSIGFEAEGYDEMAYARSAARHFGLVHHEHYLTPDELVRDIPRVASSLDQPYGNSSVLPALACAQHARDDGFEQLLAGDGGDELFGGNSRYAMQQVLDLYTRLPAGLRRSVLEPAANQWPLFRSVPGLKQMGGYVRHAHVPMPDRLDNFRMLRRLDPAAILDPDFSRKIDPARPRAEQRETWQAIRAGSLVNRMLAYDWKYTLADNDLPKVRHATDLAGIAVAFPFLDRDVTDFSLSLPPRWKLRRLKLRWFFKQALRDFLPPDILAKRKHGFGLPYGPWLLRSDRLRALAEDALTGVSTRGIVQATFARELLDKRLAEAPGYYGEMIWLLMMLELWLRGHAAHTPPIKRAIGAG